MKLTIKQLKSIIKENLLFENKQFIKKIQKTIGTKDDGSWGKNSQRIWVNWISSNIDAIKFIIPNKSIKKEKLLSAKNNPTEFGKLALGDSSSESYKATSKLMDLYEKSGGVTYSLGNKINIGGVDGQKLIKKIKANNKVITTYFMPNDGNIRNMQKRIPPNKFSKLSFNNQQEIEEVVDKYDKLKSNTGDSKKGKENKPTGSSGENGLSDSFVAEVLVKIIAEDGARKGFRDLMKLDGGTVGIAHFAAGGLGGLYNGMGDDLVKKFFGKYNPEIDSVDAIKKATKRGNGYCRISEHGDRNDCWNSLKWWKDGMFDFVNSSEGPKVQKDAWLVSHGRPALALASKFSSIHPEWKTKRGVAVLACFVNSGGTGSAKSWTNNGKRTPNESIDWYAINKAKRVRSRFVAINHYYPDNSGNFKPEWKPNAYKNYSPVELTQGRRQYYPSNNDKKAKLA